MHTLVKKVLYISCILFGLLNQNLYAFSCQSAESAIIWNIDTVTVSQIDGQRTPIKQITNMELARNCDVSGIGSYHVTVPVNISKTTWGSYRLSNGLELNGLYFYLSTKIIHNDNSTADIGWMLYPNNQSPEYEARDKTATYIGSVKGDLIYHSDNNNDGKITPGVFYTKIGSFDIQYGPTIPVYIRGDLVVSPVCSVVTMDTVVHMPNMQVSDFHNVHQSVGVTVPINLELSCPPDMPEVSIRLDASRASNANHALNGILIPDTTSTTNGITIQLVDNQNNPIDLNKEIKSRSTDNGIVRHILMKARYFQTKKTVKVGILNSTISFDLVYQ